jgi:hypothetical protein
MYIRSTEGWDRVMRLTNRATSNRMFFGWCALAKRVIAGIPPNKQKLWIDCLLLLLDVSIYRKMKR